MPNANNNKMLMYGGIGVAVLVVIIIAFVMMKKERYQACPSVSGCTSGMYGSVSGCCYGPPNLAGTSVPLSASLLQTPQPTLLTADSSGNLSTGFDGVPCGTILMWMGVDNTKLPPGWALCDGSTVTVGGATYTMPNFSGRFPVGAAAPGANTSLSQYNPGDIGGEEMTTLIATQIPAHNHPITPVDSTSAGCSKNPLKTPTMGSGSGITTGCQGSLSSPLSAWTDYNDIPFIGGQNGETIPHNNLPPFMGVAFIMKLSNTQLVS